MAGRSALAWMVVISLWQPVAAAAADELARGFADPPCAARPWAYWWWLDSYATREGITEDLEEMKRQGIAGVLLFDAGEGKGSPVGPVFMSPDWRELFKHAIREADRLGMEVGVNLCSGWDAGGTWVTPEHAAKWLVWSSSQVQGPGVTSTNLPQPEVREDYYRDITVIALPGTGRPAGAAGLKNWDFKAARIFLNQPADIVHDEAQGPPDERDCESRQVVDLTSRMDTAGTLTWEAPPGTWTVLRFGYTLLGAKTKCVSPGSQGYEIDFLSKEAMDLHWAETAEKMFADAGPLTGKTLKYVHDDSYEVAGPGRTQLNWTPAFRAEFKARRGYDPLPYLPVLAGKIVDSREVSNRFLWDYRRTIGDLFAENHYRRMHELAYAHGVGTHPESGGPFWLYIDALEVEGINDIPMGEFWKRVPEQPDGKITWADHYRICDTVKQAASAAHIYGKPLCQAEAFTSMGPNWEEDLFDLKDIGDRAFCAGLTRNVLCFYVHQPRLDIKPGYQWEAAGTHFDRNVTWWDMSHAWLKYLARCQYLLQQGLFVADVCYFYGEGVPGYVPARTHMRPRLPKGYDCDTINADVLLNRLSVRNGRLVLPDGMSYRLLVLPEQGGMSPRVLHNIKELVEAGATVVGRRPQRAPGLTDHPQCDVEVKRLADELWGNVDGEQATERQVGQGRIIWGKPLGEILAADGVPPDFEYHANARDAHLDFIHRAWSAAGSTVHMLLNQPDRSGLQEHVYQTHNAIDLYFVANQQDRPEKARCVFRVADRQPEIWDAVTGERWEASNLRQENGRIIVPMEFMPRQSWFVVFRKPIGELGSKGRNFPALATAAELAGSWTVKFDPKWGGPESVVFDQLEDWTSRSEPGIKYYSGRAVYQKTFDLPEVLREPGKQLYLDLGKVENVADVRLNGKDLGVLWTAPWHVEVTGAAQPTENTLEIGVVNLWPNRLIGDTHLPPEKRLTVTNVKKFKKDSPLLPSGLLGPVTLKMSNRPR